MAERTKGDVLHGRSEQRRKVVKRKVFQLCEIFSSGNAINENNSEAIVIFIVRSKSIFLVENRTFIEWKVFIANKGKVEENERK